MLSHLICWIKILRRRRDGWRYGWLYPRHGTNTHFLRTTLSLDRKLLHMHIFYFLLACLAQKTRFRFDLCSCQPQLRAGFSLGFVSRAGSITWTVCLSFRVSLFPPPQQVRKCRVDTCCKPLNQGPRPILLPQHQEEVSEGVWRGGCMQYSLFFPIFTTMSIRVPYCGNMSRGAGWSTVRDKLHQHEISGCRFELTQYFYLSDHSNETVALAKC